MLSVSAVGRTRRGMAGEKGRDPSLEGGAFLEVGRGASECKGPKQNPAGVRREPGDRAK